MYGTSLRLASLALFLSLASTVAADEFRDLFDGKSLDGWVVEGPAKDKTGAMMWSVGDGKIACLGEGFGFLRYDRSEFSDFTLRVEYRFIAKPGGKPQANSGLGIRTGRFDPERSPRPARRTPPSRSNCSTTRAVRRRCTGPGRSIGTRARPPTRAAGPEWNTIEVACTGPKITVRLNDQIILEADQSELADVKTKPATAPAPKDKPRKGYVALQSHSGRVEFRKVQIGEPTHVRDRPRARSSGKTGAGRDGHAPCAEPGPNRAPFSSRRQADPAGRPPARTARAGSGSMRRGRRRRATRISAPSPWRPAMASAGSSSTPTTISPPPTSRSGRSR